VLAGAQSYFSDLVKFPKERIKMATKAISVSFQTEIKNGIVDIFLLILIAVASVIAKVA
jgi:hypothetical protein